MRNRPVSYLIIGLLPVFWATAPRAETPAPSAEAHDVLIAEVAGLNRSLEQLVELLREGLAHQKIDVMLKRIELKERRLSPLEKQVRDTQGTIMSVRSELTRLEELKKQAEQDLADSLREGDEPAINTARYMLAELEPAIRSEQARLEEFERRVIQLEDELAEGREEIAILDEMLAELLE